LTRRLLPLAAVAGLALATLILAPAVTAQESVGSGAWAGSRVYRPEAITRTPFQTTIAGSLQHDAPFTEPLVSISFGAAPTLCPPLPGPVTASVTRPAGGDPGVYLFSAKITLSSSHCNGRFGVNVEAAAFPTSGVDATVNLTTTLDVAVAPEPVRGVSAHPDASGRRVDVRWQPDTSSPSDFLGYRVERMSGSDAVTVANIDDRGATSFTDTAPPSEGGAVVYRVSARRRSPSGEVSSSPTSSSSVVVQPDPNPPTVPPGTTPDPANPGTGAPGPGDPAAPGDTPTTGPGRAIGSRVRPPLLGTGGFFPPLLTPRGPTTTIDDGFSPELPFGDREAGEDESELPGDELALSYEDEASRGLIVPIATALVLAVWAFHLRFLARAAAP
jgi:hypothetical protein